jgi:hypothetical protein
LEKKLPIFITQNFPKKKKKSHFVSVEHNVGALSSVRPHLGISGIRKGMLLKAFFREVTQRV